MNIQHIDAEFVALRNKIAEVIEQRDRLRKEIAIQKIPRAEGELAEILRAALRGDVGWVERARAALGDYKIIHCEECGTPFKSGGKRKKHCGNC